MACFIRPLAIAGVIALAICIVFHKVLGQAVTVAGRVMEFVFLAAIAAVISWLVYLGVKARERRQAARGACLTCERKCQGRQDAKATILLHPVRLGDEEHGLRAVPDVPVLHAANVYSLAAWKERHENQTVG